MRVRSSAAASCRSRSGLPGRARGPLLECGCARSAALAHAGRRSTHAPPHTTTPKSSGDQAGRGSWPTTRRGDVRDEQGDDHGGRERHSHLFGRG